MLHFASAASPVDYLEHPIETLKAGSMGTHKALDLAREKGARFLLAPTSECCGDPLIHRQPVDYWGNVNPVGLRGVRHENLLVPLIEDYDLTQEADVIRMYNDMAPSVVIHLAAEVGGIGANRENPGRFFYVAMCKQKGATAGR